ncbi:hypothetical protein GCM10025864_24200 [Luteimicrobium album]|uniref:Lipoprotein n=2 Tax=Luteimicrobium album TaxID=1054550 RepID=A0ABQ6I320_9MICO|nr:hypothetical protein GCM10025864_24200 [Luteimicrobium album]
MNRSTARMSKLLAVPVALASAAALSACSPTQTNKPYQPSDGIDVVVGDVKGINLLVLSSGKGDPGRLLGSFYNAGSDAATVTVAPEGASSATVSVDPSSTTQLGAEGPDDVVFDTTGAAPGAVLPVKVTVGDATETVSVPVLDGTLPEYATLVPTASAEG